MNSVVIGVIAAAGIMLFFWGLDSRRAARMAATLAADAGYAPPAAKAPPANLRERLVRLFQPAAARMEERKTRKGKPTLAERLAKADLKLRTSEFLMIQIATAVGFALLGVIRFGVGIQMLIAATLGWLAPGIYVRRRQRKRLRAFNDQLGDTLVLLANALKAGYSFAQAMDVVAKKAMAPVSIEFGRVVREMNLGSSPDESLRKMVRRVDSPDLDLVVTAVSINQTVGGNLAEILETISHTIRERIRIKGEIRTLTAQARASGWVITALPIGLAGLMYVLTPAYFKPMAQSIVGGIMIAIACGLILMGNFLIRKVIAIEV
ncbi:MAG: type II secretion system F family protein [Candidatus Dormibacteraceae bacterium]